MIQILLVGFLALLSFQAYEGDGLGPHKVGWEDIQFIDQNFNRHQVEGGIFIPPPKQESSARRPPPSAHFLWRVLPTDGPNRSPTTFPC